MINGCRRSASLLAIFATLVVSTVVVACLEAQSAVGLGTEAPAGPATQASPQGARGGDADEADRPGDLNGPLYTFRYKFRPSAVTYYIIENEIRDDTSISSSIGLLGSNTLVKDRRSIIQRILAPTTRPADSADLGEAVKVSWECDRYEVREERSTMGRKDEHAFDSLRDSYPPAGYREFGKIPGSTVTFELDLQTGKATGLKITPAKVEGPRTRGKLSRTAEKCSLTRKALQDVLHLLGPYYLPATPKAVGEQWTLTHSEAVDPFGTVITSLDCQLQSVREIEGRKIATLDLVGRFSLKAEPKPTTSAATSRPGRRRKKPKERNFILERTACTGTVEFDLTRGELVRVTLRRDLEGRAGLESKKSEQDPPAEVRSSVSRVFRARVLHSPPPRPVIVGGPKPPAIAPKDIIAARPAPKRRSATTRPDRGRSASGRGTTQPVRRGGRSTVGKRGKGRKTAPTRKRPRLSHRRKARPTTQRGRRSPPAGRGRPTTQPLGD